MQRIHQQQFSNALAAKGCAHSEAPDERRRHEGILRQFAGEFFRQDAQIHRMLREGVVPGDRFPVWSRDECGGDAPAHVLAGLLLKVVVQDRDAAGKTRAVVRCVEQFKA